MIEIFLKTSPGPPISTVSNFRLHIFLINVKCKINVMVLFSYIVFKWNKSLRLSFDLPKFYHKSQLWHFIVRYLSRQWQIVYSNSEVVYLICCFEMYMLFAVRWQHDEQPSGRAALPRILHCHHVAASYFIILTINTFIIIFSITIVINTFVCMYTFRAVKVFRWTFHFIVLITWFVYFRDCIFVFTTVCFLVCLSEHLLYVDGELGADYLGEGQQSAGYIHGIVDVPVPQLKHDAAPLLLISRRS